MGEEGIALYGEGRYEEALARFDRAEAVVAAPTLGVRAARSLEKLGRLVEASERYLRVTAMTIDPTLPEIYRQAQAQAQAEAAAERAALLPRIPTLEIVVTGGPADEVTVDGARIPAALLGARRPVDPGEHVVVARRGEARAEKRLALAETATERVELRLPAPAPIDEPPPPVRHKPRPPVDTSATSPGAVRTLGWISLAAGGASATLGVVTLALALDEKAALEARCPDHACRQSQLGADGKRDLDTYDTLSTTTTVAFVAAGVFAAGGAALLIASPKAARKRAPSGVHVAAAPGPRGVAAIVAGAFE